MKETAMVSPKTEVLVQTQTTFNSPTWGALGFEEVFVKAADFISGQTEEGEAASKYRYRLIVGTDSAPRNGEHTEYITAFIIHRVGLGGVYFWKRTVQKRAVTLRERIYREASLSIDFAKFLVERLVTEGLLDLDLEIHVDVGKVGETRDIITEVVGMVRGNGFEVKTKPESFGASKVADRHT